MLAGSAVIGCGELSVEMFRDVIGCGELSVKMFRDVELQWYLGGKKLGLIALVLPKNCNGGGIVLLMWSGESVALIVEVITGCGPTFSRFVVQGRGNFGLLLCCG